MAAVVVDRAKLARLIGGDWLVDSLCDSDALADSEALIDADALADSEALIDSDSLVESDVPDSTSLAVDSLDSPDGAADSLALCDVPSDFDSEADSLVGAVLPGLRTVLPSVARVFRCSAVMS